MGKPRAIFIGAPPGGVIGFGDPSKMLRGDALRQAWKEWQEGWAELIREFDKEIPIKKVPDGEA